MARWLRLIVSLGLLALALTIAAPENVLALLRNLDLRWLALAIAALSGQILLSAWRWHITARSLGLVLSRRFALREYGLSVAANTFLPGGVLGDLTRIARARHLGLREVTASVLIERLAGQVVMSALALAAILYWLGPWLGALVILGTTAFIAALLRYLEMPRTYLIRVWIVSGRWRSQIMLTLAILALNLAGYWCAARATGLALSPVAIMLLVPLTLTAMLLPVTINGWGLREGFAVTLWPLWGIDPAQAMVASVIFGLSCMGAALFGLGPMLLADRTDDAKAAPPPDQPGSESTHQHPY